MTAELDKARDEVLVENTAQAVFKHLDRIEDNRGALELRWIWELLQNARDSARADGVHIRVRLSSSSLRFEHNGTPFRSSEIAHLIYHGSTKIENFDNIGQFGSGFLTTHLLSRVVRVEGWLRDTGGFVFQLNRSGRSVDDLRLAMNRSWNAFQQSAQNGVSDPSSNTSFTYEVEEEGHKLAQNGLTDLHRCGPLVMAFCAEIASIKVETTDTAWRLDRGERTVMDDRSVLSIHDQHNGRSVTRSVVVAGDPLDLCAALKLSPSEQGFAVDEEYELVPKIFVLFPLVGTDRLGLPVSINSSRFKPREDRDGVVLAGTSPGAEENRQLLEDAVRHQSQILQWCASERWKGAERLLAFDSTRLPDWADLDDQWFHQRLRALVAVARATPLMRTLSGDWIEPQRAWLPTTGDATHRDRLWSLMSSWTDARVRLPWRDHLAIWSRNLDTWAKLLDVSTPEMDEALTTASVATLISDVGSVTGLQERLEDGDGLVWLTSVLQLVHDARDTRLLDDYDMLPSQAGILRRRRNLHRDTGICEDLKDIAEAFGARVRNDLLDTRVTINGISELLAVKKELDLLDQVVSHLNQDCHDGSIASSLVPSVIKLFWWIVARKEYHGHLDGYPAPTVENSDGRVSVLHLKPMAEGPKRPMAPVSMWPVDARRFASLFPKRRVLAEAFDAIDAGGWGALSKYGYVNISPLLQTKRTMDAFLPDEPLPETEGNESHESIEAVSVSDLAFLSENNVGLMDTVRKSRKRAIEFLRFLVEFVIPNDPNALEEVDVNCECLAEHKIYRAAWLVPLSRRKWVPLDTDGRRAAPVSAEALAGLLADSPDVVELLSSETGERLMRALSVSRADFALRVMASDEETRVALIHSVQELKEAAAGDVDRVLELASEIREHPEIIESIEDQKARRARIQRNQDIGRIVEDLLRQELRDRGLEVRRTGRGSDFEVGQVETESDHVEDGVQVWFEVMDGDATTFFIEVKSTTTDQVKMTPIQAEEACRLGDRFALCVVPVESDGPTDQTIRKQLRVVFGVGASLRYAFQDYTFWQEAAEDVLRHRGAIEMVVVGGQVRFGIGRSIWGDALTFEEAIVRFKRGP